MLTREEIEEWMRGLQDRTCTLLESEDGKARFMEDIWERPGGGGGRTRVITDGDLLEKGGVNFSAVHGLLNEKMAQALELPGREFYATGVSSVLHPKNPHVPIIHMNVRYFEMNDETWWFGGGIDLTPHYIDQDHARRFHLRLKTVCDMHSKDYYPEFSKWAEKYFYIPHRKETRGVGGIFFDRLGPGRAGREEVFNFVRDVGNTYASLWVELANEKRSLPFSESEKQWQLLRRGRYVEFNLVYDKGTKFGLETDGRIESILMSLPTLAKWEYDHMPSPDSPEAKTLHHLKNPSDWLND